MIQSQLDSKSHQVYPYTLAPVTVGPVTFKNRIIYPAWMLNYAETDGTVSEKLSTYYTNLAKGGCGMVMTGCAVVSGDGIPFDRVMRLDSDEYIPGLKTLFAAIKADGAVPGIQLVHYGRQSSTSVSGDVLMAPSALPCPVMSQYDPDYKVKEMTPEDIHKLRDDFIAAAERAVRAGAEVVELHATHGYLLNQFMSPYSNKRTDLYGGSTVNRCRLIVEILEGMHRVLKAKGDVALMIRVNGNEFVDGGLTPKDYQEIMPMLEKTGLDLLSVSAGVYESMLRIVPTKEMGETPHVELAAQIKPFTSLPIVGVGSVFSLAAAEATLREGKADLIAMGRAQHADPFIVGKSAAGKEAEVRKCIHCNSCTFWTTGDPETYCAVNPDYKKKKK